MARELGLPWGTLQYVVLGDDILIGDPRVGKRYVKLIRELGVEVSPTKTYVSSEISEFAKRYLYKGTEVSPLPLTISEVRSVPEMVSALLGAGMKGLIPVDGIPVAVQRLLEETGSTQRESREGGIQAFYCQKATSYLRGEITAGEFVAVVCSRLGHPVLPDGGLDSGNPEVWGGILLRTAMVDLLQQSLVVGANSFADTYDRVSDMVLYNPARSLWWADLEAHVPLLALAVQIDRVVIDLAASLESLPWTREDWKTAIRVMYNPLARDSFGVSPAKRRARVGDRLGVLVRKYLEDPSLLAAVDRDRGGPLAVYRGGLLLGDSRAPKVYRVSTVPSGRVIRDRLRLHQALSAAKALGKSTSGKGLGEFTGSPRPVLRSTA